MNGMRMKALVELKTTIPSQSLKKMTKKYELREKPTIKTASNVARLPWSTELPIWLKAIRAFHTLYCFWLKESGACARM